MIIQHSDINPEYGDLYFSRENGLEESEYIFIDGNSIKERIKEGGSLHIGETGFGTGLNFLTLIKVLGAGDFSRVRVKYSSIELYPLEPERIRQLLSPFAESLGDILAHYELCWAELFPGLKAGWNESRWNFKGIEVDFRLFYGDAQDWSREEKTEEVDAWFLDGHSPDKNPEIWSASIMKAVYNNTVTGGTLASFTASGTVKRPLREAGFTIKRKKGFGRKRHMIQGLKS
ncbi:MAG: tRNA (5-methylaminomethyl-2-thiouridine)(34)-methyltransferase MnmD [Spirochaetales bacterium]|nr:tRNA (5-methylaminomethyl-2-thiouridine)(34)-methyltransferase MnmD [Spirochaetales bacterium]